jgi:hypothetical protein
MKINIFKNKIVVKKEPTDKKFYTCYGGWSDGESQFLYAVKQLLKKAGYDVIKKRMYKDGHLVDDKQQYLRARNGVWCAYNDHWAINGLNEDFNNGEATLTVTGKI